MKRSFIILGIVAGVIGGALMIFLISFISQGLNHQLTNSFGILIPLLTIITPQYFTQQIYDRANYIQLFLSGWIASIFWISSISFFGYFLEIHITSNLEKAAMAIGIGAIVSLVTAFLMHFIKKRKKVISDSLDDIDYL